MVFSFQAAADAGKLSLPPFAGEWGPTPGELAADAAIQSDRLLCPVAVYWWLSGGRQWCVGTGGGFLKAFVWVAILNFLVNALLLVGTACMAGQRVPIYRLLAASILGAVYATACLVPGWAFLGGLLWRLVSLGLMGLIAYGRDGRLCCIFAVLTMAMGGAVLAAGRGGQWQLPLFGVLLYLLGKTAFCQPGRRLLPVTIRGRGKELSLKALLDTGNELRDPITGESVLVIGCQAARELTGLTAEQLKQPIKTMTDPPIPGLRLIPYRAVGAENGLLLALRFPFIRVGERSRPGIVAFAPQSFGEDFQAIAGGMF